MTKSNEILGYEGKYTVSTLGIITSIARINGTGTRYKNKELLHDKTELPSGTYSRVTLCDNGVPKRYSVHRLVAEAFIPNPSKKPFVNHIDNNPQNNNVSNLEWCSHAENMKHAQNQGRLTSSQSKGGKASSKLTIAKFDHKAKEILSEQFMYSEPTLTKTGLKGKRRAYYNCKLCGLTASDTLVSKAIKIHSGICQPCQIRNKI